MARCSPAPGTAGPDARMDPVILISIALLMALAAALYSSVGHGGASAYLAIMALFAVPAATMRPTALALNLLVAGFATVRYVRAGEFNTRLFLSFAVTAVPFADRKSVVLGKRVSVRVDFGGGLIIKKKNKKNTTT